MVQTEHGFAQTVTYSVQIVKMNMYRMWENFGGGKFWRINGSKVFGEEKFGESVRSLLKTLAFINIGGENFGELPTVRQICQNFPPPNFSHVRYYVSYIILFFCCCKVTKSDSSSREDGYLNYQISLSTIQLLALIFLISYPHIQRN